MALPGRELALDPALGRFESLYVRCLGAPINGLRIRLRRILPATQGRFERILDAGCGIGVFTMELAKQHPEAKVIGVELDPKLVAKASDIAQRAGITNCTFMAGDVTKLGFKQEFDMTVSVDNLEHIEKDVEALKNLRESLKPGGLLVVHVPGYYRRWLVFGKRVNFDVPGHVRPGYTREQLTEKLETAGFKVMEDHYTYGILETLTNNISYLITGADRRNRLLYAMTFPILLAVSYLGQFSRPRWGAGVLAIAKAAYGADGVS